MGCLERKEHFPFGPSRPARLLHTALGLNIGLKTRRCTTRPLIPYRRPTPPTLVSAHRHCTHGRSNGPNTYRPRPYRAGASEIRHTHTHRDESAQTQDGPPGIRGRVGRRTRSPYTQTRCMGAVFAHRHSTQWSTIGRLLRSRATNRAGTHVPRCISCQLAFPEGYSLSEPLIIVSQDGLIRGLESTLTCAREVTSIGPIVPPSAQGEDQAAVAAAATPPCGKAS